MITGAKNQMHSAVRIKIQAAAGKQYSPSGASFITAATTQQWPKAGYRAHFQP